MNLEARYGPLTLRAWGLVANFLSNALALYGLARTMQGDGGEPMLAAGVIATLVFLWVLSTPPAAGPAHEDWK